jgi:hypothetical protein
MTDRGMARVWLPDEIAERVRLAATARGLTLQKLGEQLVLEGLEQLRRQEKREHSAANRARRARSCEHVSTVLGRFDAAALEHPGSIATGEGRHDVEPSSGHDVVTPDCAPGPLTCR